MLRKLLPNLTGSFPYFTWGGSTTFSDGSITNESRNKSNSVQPRSIMEELPSFPRRQLVQFGRYLDENQSYVNGVFSDIVDYSIRSGLTPVFHGGDETWQKEQLAAFKAWAESPTASGANNLTAELKVIVRAWLRDGECFVSFTQKSDGSPCIQTLETHVFSDIYGFNVTKAAGFLDGVRYSDTGQPLEYQTFAGESLPASGVLHVCEPTRAGQLRVAPAWRSSINNLFDVKELDQLAKQGFKLQLVIPTFIQRAGGAQNPRDKTFGPQTAPTTTSEDSQQFQKVTGVVMQDVPMGSVVNNLRPEYPGPLYTVFKESFIRDFCVGVRWPYDFVTLSSLNGTQQRTVIEKAKARAEVIQDTIVWPVLKRAMLHWLAYRIASGETAAVDNWWNVGFRRPRDLSIDLGRDTKAIADEVSKALMGPEEYYALYGQTASEEFAKGAAVLGLSADQYRRLWMLQNYGAEAMAMLSAAPVLKENPQSSENTA